MRCLSPLRPRAAYCEPIVSLPCKPSLVTMKPTASRSGHLRNKQRTGLPICESTFVDVFDALSMFFWRNQSSPSRSGKVVREEVYTSGTCACDLFH